MPVPTAAPRPFRAGPSPERTVALTDAVVAIAMTLLVLPLVEAAGEVDTEHLGSFFGERWNLLLSFGLSFVVIYAFWAAQSAAYQRLAALDVEVDVPALRRLSLWWLLAIAFLPFPTAVLGREINSSSAPLYIASLLVLSALTASIGVVVDRVAGPSPAGRWVWSRTVVLVFCGLVSLANATLGIFSLALLALVRVNEVRLRRSRPTGDGTGPPAEP